MQLFRRSAFEKIRQNPWSQTCRKTRVDKFAARPADISSNRTHAARTSFEVTQESPEGATSLRDSAPPLQ